KACLRISLIHVLRFSRGHSLFLSAQLLVVEIQQRDIACIEQVLVPPVDLVLVLLATVLSAYEDCDEIDVIVIEAEVILRMMIVDIRVCVIGIADIDVNFVEVYAPLRRVTVLNYREQSDAKGCIVSFTVFGY